MLTVMGLLHNNKIKSIFASDVNCDVLGIADKNLSLLSVKGLNKRKEQIREYIQLYNKESHISALESAERLSHLVLDSNMESVTLFQSDVTASHFNSEKFKRVELVKIGKRQLAIFEPINRSN